MKRPFVQLKAAMSLDGYLSGPGRERLLLSSPEDMAAVDALRATFDAILVGAETLRRDNPRLLVRDPALVRERQGRGLPPQPQRLVLTSSGDIPADARVFAEAHPVTIFAPTAVAKPAGLPDHVRWHALPGVDRDALLRASLAALVQAGIQRLLVEGGAQVHRSFAAQGAFDALRLAIAPVCVGPGGVRLFDEQAATCWPRACQLEQCEKLGDTAVLHLTRKS